MRFLKLSKKRLQLSVLFGLLFAVTLSMVRFDAGCQELRRNVLRLHIIANSDSESDQRVKLAVRDKILETSSSLFEDETNLQEAQAAVAKHLPLLEEAANRVLRQEGYGYTAAVTLEDSFFETREYDSFTLPAGTYRSVMVRLGKAGGKNWWCVVFPALCIPAAAPEARLTDAVSEETAQMAESASQYQMRFKIVEILEDFKKMLAF